VKKEKDDFLTAQGLAAANCLIRDTCNRYEDLQINLNEYPNPNRVEKG